MLEVVTGLHKTSLIKASLVKIIAPGKQFEQVHLIDFLDLFSLRSFTECEFAH